MAENRKLKRRELIYNLKVLDTDTNNPVGRAVDITAEGMKMLTYKKMEANRKFMLSIELPMEVFGTNKVFCSAKVCWCRRDINPDFFACGMQFLDISPDDTEALITVMSQCSFSE